MILPQLEKARLADVQTREHIIRELAENPSETLDAVIAVLGIAAKPVWKIAIQVIRAIGYPRNAVAIPALMDQISDLNSPARDEAIQALAEMGTQVVVPHLINAMLDSSQKREYWLDTIAGICSMLRAVEAGYAIRCGPVVTYLLGQQIPPGELDPWYLLIVLEKIGPECAEYALPTLIDIVSREGASETGQQAWNLIASFDEQVREPYKLLLTSIQDRAQKDQETGSG